MNRTVRQWLKMTLLVLPEGDAGAAGVLILPPQGPAAASRLFPPLAPPPTSCPPRLPAAKSGTNSGKTAGVAAPRGFGLRSGLGCGLGFAFGKSLVRLQTSPRVSMSTRGTTHG